MADRDVVHPLAGSGANLVMIILRLIRVITPIIAARRQDA